MILCGFYETVITPALGSPMPGAGHERISTGIKDDLYAKAFVLECRDEGSSGAVFAAVVALDAIDLARKEVERIRERIAALTPIPADNITVCSTHSHTSGPTIRTSYVKAVDPEYLDWLVLKAADAAVLACEQRAEAQIGFGLGKEEGISFQRRFWMKDGSVATNPGIGNPEIAKPAGPIDPDVAVMRIDDLSGRPLGIVVNFACHPDVVGGLEYSGDYPGELSRTLKRVYGEHVVVLFLQGASGNINHIDVSGNWLLDRKAHYLKMGRILAGEVMKVREKICCTPQPSIRMKRAFVPIRYRRPSAEELAEAKRTVQSAASANPLALNLARQVIQLAEREEEQTEAEIQAWAFGETAFVFMPAEIFAEFGLEIKRRSPFALTIVTELSNGSVSGYVCTQEAYKQGGYENKLREYSRLQAEAGDLFAEQALQLLQALKTEPQVS